MVSVRPGSGPTVLRILLGSRLRTLREAGGITREDAGYAIRASGSKISRMELGRVSFKERDIADLLALYGLADPAERAGLLDLARQANAAEWWHDYADVLPEWFHVYLGLEQAASQIGVFEQQFVPGLLQTPDYARAVLRRGGLAEPGRAERRVSLRMRRQQVLTGAEPALLRVIMDEAVLRRWVGGADVMRGQLERLVAAAKEPNVHIQVLPLGSGHAADAGSFTLLRSAEPGLPAVAYVEHLTGALYLDRPDDTQRYAQALDRLGAASEPAEAAGDVLNHMLAETYR